MKNKFLKYHLKYHQNQKYLEINLTKSMQNFFTENYKTMQREKKKDPAKEIKCQCEKKKCYRHKKFFHEEGKTSLVHIIRRQCL